jgi:3-methyladenine DNA glycosylase AlkD
MAAKTIKKEPTTKKPVRSARKSTRSPPKRAQRSLVKEVQAALSSLEQMSTQRDRENLARFGITASTAFGVSMANMQVLAKRLGRSHELAAALWDTGWYEARMLTSFVDEPARGTPAQMDRWCRDFDNWGICDTVCFRPEPSSAL